MSCFQRWIFEPFPWNSTLTPSLPTTTVSAAQWPVFDSTFEKVAFTRNEDILIYIVGYTAVPAWFSRKNCLSQRVWRSTSPPDGPVAGTHSPFAARKAIVAFHETAGSNSAHSIFLLSLVSETFQVSMTFSLPVYSGLKCQVKARPAVFPSF